MARVEASVVINRPLEEVGDYMDNPENWPEWQGFVLEAELTKETPEVVGSTAGGVSHFLGQRMEWTAETTAYEQYKTVSMRIVTGPQTIDQTTTLEEVEGGTKVTMVADADPAPAMFRLAGPVVTRLYGKELQSNLDLLKEILEAEG
ncbi:MAG: SRPBCC family protein [Anaerolineae bacterium]